MGVVLGSMSMPIPRESKTILQPAFSQGPLWGCQNSLSKAAVFGTVFGILGCCIGHYPKVAHSSLKKAHSYESLAFQEGAILGSCLN